MRKLILLLFLIPNLVMAEVILLKCEGEYKNSTSKEEGLTEDGIISIQVHDEKIVVNGVSIPKSSKNDFYMCNSVEEGYCYQKSKHRIEFSLNSNSVRYEKSFWGRVDRITGEIFYVDSTLDLKVNDYKQQEFRGRCESVRRVF